MSVTELAKQLGLSKGTVSELCKKGMPKTSIEAAQSWRIQNAPPRAKAGGKKASPAARLLSPEPSDILPPRSERHTIGGVDDQGEADGDRADNLYDALRRSKASEDIAWLKVQALAGGRTDPVEFGAANRTFVSAQKHRAWMQAQAMNWAREQGITMYATEARELFCEALRSVLRQVDALALRVAPLCTDPKSARDAIEDQVTRIRSTAQEHLKTHDPRWPERT